MALCLIDGSVHLHIPKTGGNWVAEVLEESGLADHYEDHTHAHFERHLYAGRHGSGRDLLREVWRLTRLRMRKADYVAEARKTFRFCFVRNPITWWESWFRHKTDRGWNPNGTVNDPTDWHVCLPISGIQGASLNEMMEKILAIRPGFVSELYSEYVKPGIAYVGRTETLAHDLAEVLDHRGLSYQGSLMAEKSAANVSRGEGKSDEWDPDILRCTLLTELPAMMKFGYLTKELCQQYDLPERLLQSVECVGLQEGFGGA